MDALPLLLQMTIALGAAFCSGLIARHFRLPPIVGYLLAGVAIGFFPPGSSAMSRRSPSWPNWVSSSSSLG
jgi:predicted Kef-type K+ transport protein